jgi:hypothetical protein
MAINTLDPKSEEEKDPLAMPMAELPASEVGGGGMANALPVLTSAAPELTAANEAVRRDQLAASRVAQTHGAPTNPTASLLEKPRSAIPQPGMARTAEEAVASGTVVPGKIETDSVTTTVKSPESTRKVKSQETQSAANDLEFQKRRIVEATETQMDAENKIDQVALAAESRRLEFEREAADEEARKRQEIENKRVEAEAAADKELADADARVKEKQDAAINWNKGRVPFKILSAVMRAAAIPDAVRMNANADPMNNPVARTLDAALAEEKKVKQEEFLASKEWRDALKTKNAEHIKRTYDRGIAKLNIDVTAKARNLLMSEKSDQLAQRTAKLDPNGDAYRGAKDVALATLNAQDARDRITLSQPYEATVTSGGKTTTTVKKTTEGTAGKPPPNASTEDVEKVSKLEQAAKDREELAQMLEKNEKSWSNVQQADRRQSNEEAERDIPFVGKAGVAIGRMFDGHTVVEKLTKDDDTTGAEMARRLERIKTQTAKGYGGAITSADAERSAMELGVQGQNHAAMAETMRRQAEEYRKQAAEMRRQRVFR